MSWGKARPIGEGPVSRGAALSVSCVEPPATGSASRCIRLPSQRHQQPDLFYTNITGGAGRIYGSDGSVVDAERRVRVGSLTGSGSAILVGPSTGRAYVLTTSGITVYDINTFTGFGTVPVPGVGISGLFGGGSGSSAGARTELPSWMTTSSSSCEVRSSRRDSGRPDARTVTLAFYARGSGRTIPL